MAQSFTITFYVYIICVVTSITDRRTSTCVVDAIQVKGLTYTSQDKLHVSYIKQNCNKQSFTNLIEDDTRKVAGRSCTTRFKSSNDLDSKSEKVNGIWRKSKKLKSSKKMRKREKKDKLRRAAKSRKKYKRKKL